GGRARHLDAQARLLPRGVATLDAREAVRHLNRAPVVARLGAERDERAQRGRAARGPLEHLLVGRGPPAPEAAPAAGGREVAQRGPPELARRIEAQAQVLVDADRAAHLAALAPEAREREVAPGRLRIAPHDGREDLLRALEIAIEQREERLLRRRPGVTRHARVPPERPRHPAHGASRPSGARGPPAPRAARREPRPRAGRA